MSPCVYCNRKVDADGYRLVYGWERKATAISRRGGSDIVLREPGDTFACSSCITRMKLGMNAQQESLI